MRKFVGLLVLVSAGWTSMSGAATITVSGQDYEITTVTGFYHNYIDTLDEQIWWGNPSLAEEFASTLGTSMGTLNGGVSHPYGPAFGYSIFDGPGYDYMNAYAYKEGYKAGPRDVNAPSGLYWTYGVATPVVSPVPLPAAAWLFGSALLGLIGYSKRKGAKSNA